MNLQVQFTKCALEVANDSQIYAYSESKALYVNSC